jgi:hypothetical protein
LSSRVAARPTGGRLRLDPRGATRGWVVLMVIGLASAAGMWVYHWWLERQRRC